MSIYFDRTIPFYLTRYPSFDGIKVDVDETEVEIVEALRALIKDTDQAIVEAASPERSNQALAERFVEGLREIIDVNK